MSKITVYRIQDAEGRGPYRPGFSHRWVDGDHDRNPPFMVEFDWPLSSIPGRWLPGENGGCAFRSLEALRRWFSPSECEKLETLGYSIVSMTVDRVIAESDRQLVFGRWKKLSRGYLMLPWSMAEAQPEPSYSLTSKRLGAE